MHIYFLGLLNSNIYNKLFENIKIISEINLTNFIQIYLRKSIFVKKKLIVTNLAPVQCKDFLISEYID